LRDVRALGRLADRLVAASAAKALADLGDVPRRIRPGCEREAVPVAHVLPAKAVLVPDAQVAADRTVRMDRPRIDLGGGGHAT
jgi:hypothetical protein